MLATLCDDCGCWVGAAFIESACLGCELAELEAGGLACLIESLVFVLCRWKEPEVRLDVEGVSGDDESTGEVGLSRVAEPVESFVRFFLRNPRVGIEAEGARAACSVQRPRGMRGACEASGTAGRPREQQLAPQQARGGQTRAWRCAAAVRRREWACRRGCAAAR